MHLDLDFKAIQWIKFQDVIDERGRLTAIEQGTHVPFDIQRIFYVHQVVPGFERGGHAHIETDQVITTAYGKLKVDVSNGITSKTYIIENPSEGLYVPRMYWIRLYDFSDGGVCLVLANTKYDIKKSLRTWMDYLSARGLPENQAQNKDKGFIDV